MFYIYNVTLNCIMQITSGNKQDMVWYVIRSDIGNSKRKLTKVRGFFIAILFDVSCSKLFLAGINKYVHVRIGRDQ